MVTTNRGKILIIEDTAGFRRVYQDVLESEGYDVVDADDGIWGLQLAIEEKPDMVILDLILPGMHGYEVLTELRANPNTKSIPVIVLSSLGDGKDIRRAMDLGANDYSVKGSVAPRDILTKIRLVLNETGTTQEATKYQLSVKETMADASELSLALGLNGSLMCSKCHGEIMAELFPDNSRDPGKWFSAHFVCPRCNTNF
ncbi:MAG: response regulator [Chloroflexi bacterium]|nr:response regulator [Chloroflexota bacterium]